MNLLLSFTLLLSVAFAQKADFTNAEANVLKADAMKLWQKRDDQSSLEEALSKFEKVAETNKDLETYAYLVRGYYTLADLHMTNDDLKKRTFEKARTFGEQGLELNPEYKKLSDDDIEKAIDKLSEKEVPVLFWAAASLGKWAKLNGVMSSLKYKGQILAMVRRVEKVKPDYFFGAVPRYWGGFYAVAPSIAGGDMKLSKKKFHEAIAAAPAHLGSKVLYAELYCVKEDDKKEFKKTLDEVIASGDGPEEIAPENRLEKKKAERLLSKMNDLF